MQNVLEMLSGKKTYLVGGLGLVVIGCWMAGLLDDAMATQILTLLGFGGAITLRAAIAKASS